MSALHILPHQSITINGDNSSKEETNPMPGRLYIHPQRFYGYYETNEEGVEDDAISFMELCFKNVVELKAPLPTTTSTTSNTHDTNHHDGSPAAYLVGQVIGDPSNINLTIQFADLLSMDSLYENFDFNQLQACVASYITEEAKLQPDDWSKLKRQIVEIGNSSAKHVYEAHNAQNLCIRIDIEIKTVKMCDEQELTQTVTKRAEGLKMKKFDINKELTEGGACSVCLDKFLTGEGKNDVRFMPCSHLFHQRCITPWLQVNKNCPVCRFQVHNN